jgi:hypothetical protein
MDWCQIEMGEERGRQMRAVFEDLLGEPCPCAQGKTCPLTPRPEAMPA